MYSSSIGRPAARLESEFPRIAARRGRDDAYDERMPTRGTLLLLLAALPACSRSSIVADDPSAMEEVADPSARVRLLATDMRFTEGPVWVPRDGGYLVFSDMTANRLMRWSAADGLTVYRDPSPEPNGNTLDAEGRLVTCEHGARRISRTETDGEVVALVERAEGRRLHSPNDLVFGDDGALWFTDPRYGLRGREPELDGDYVFRRAPDGTVTIAADDFHRPNGLCLSPDGRRLYVADSGDPKHVRAFSVWDDGVLSDGAVFYELVDAGIPDGLECDEAGRLYVTARDGVHVVADGKRIGRIRVVEPCTNVAFGGADGRTLFITAGKSLWAIDLKVRGLVR